jgi:tetratricopeptide (TPR) repeat protein
VLRNYAFVSVSEIQSESVFEMHALVQLAMRTWLKVKGDLERWKRHYCKTLSIKFPTGEYENWAICQELFPHAQSAATQQPEEQDALRDWASILCKAASYAWRIGKGVEAEEMSIQAIKVQKKILGQKHKDTLASMEMLGLAYELRGKYDLAEPLYHETLQLQEKVLGKEHPDTLSSMNNLATLFYNQGKYDLAKPLYYKTLKLQEKVLGKEHPDCQNMGLSRVAYT